jgi:hypothetical protein
MQQRKTRRKYKFVFLLAVKRITGWEWMCNDMNTHGLPTTHGRISIFRFGFVEDAVEEADMMELGWNCTIIIGVLKGSLAR